jgi:hypothetical protein
MKHSKLDREGNFIYIGKYDFGKDVVGLLAEVETGDGHCCISAAKAFRAQHSKVEGLQYLTVGIRPNVWSTIYGTLMHEALEYMYCKLRLRYESTEAVQKSHATYLFSMGHADFAEAVTQTAQFMAACEGDLKRIWKQLQKK